jgi:hypothetical protein
LIHPDVHQGSLAPVSHPAFDLALLRVLLNTVPIQLLKY